MDAVWPYLAAILPTILVATLFYFLIKGMIEGDRRERLAQKRFEAEEDRRLAADTRNPTSDDGAVPGSGSGDRGSPESLDKPPSES